MTAKDRDRDKADVEGALNFLQLVFVAGTVALIVLIASRELTTTEAWTIVGLGALGGAVAICRTRFARMLLDRLSKVTVGPVTLEVLQKKVSAVAEESPKEELAEASRPSVDVIDLRLKLERKLAYIAQKMLDDRNGAPRYVTIGSLAHDGYLDRDQARVASSLMTLRQEDLDVLPAQDRKQFLESADKLVAGIRATVFREMVKRDLESDHWIVDELPLGEDQARADYRAQKDELAYRIAPVFSTDKSSRLLNVARSRLGALDDEEALTATLAVLPNNSRAQLDPAGDPRVIQRGQLTQVLSTKPRRSVNEQAPEVASVV